MQMEKQKRNIAYFSMEIGLDFKIATYSGGLGVLAGDTIKSCADLKVPMVAVCLLYKKGHFYQKIDKNGEQSEIANEWDYEKLLTPLNNTVNIELRQRQVKIKAWQYIVKADHGFYIPVIFLDTDLNQNHKDDRHLTHLLYGGDNTYRLLQEAILGIGGVRMLNKLGYTNIKKYHMNEGHSSLLAIELIYRAASAMNIKPLDNLPAVRENVKKMCVFTTHTPVPAGHDQFSYDLLEHVFGKNSRIKLLKKLGGKDMLNMTLIALNLSYYINGVAKEHGKISRGMYPGYPVDSITNGVHTSTWVCSSFSSLYDKYITEWSSDPFSLRYAINIPTEEIWEAHMQAKKELINYVNNYTDNKFSDDVFTIGFARRSTAYKRADLIFHDIERLVNISETKGKMQIIFSGKAHPRDYEGKELIKRIILLSQKLKNRINIIYLQNYDMDLAKKIVSGVDLWLNTPKKPNEASGTSGMKAAHNGVPSLSILDGWWIEGCIENITGWSIGAIDSNPDSDREDANSLYDKLENIILSRFYNERAQWVNNMRYAISINASFFNTHRMVTQYIVSAYAY